MKPEIHSKHLVIFATCASVLFLIAACVAPGAAMAQALDAAPADLENSTQIKSAEMVFLTFDPRTGSPYVRVDRGRAHGMARGGEFLVFIDGKLFGTLVIDSVLTRACAGLLKDGPPLPTQNQPMAVDLVPQSISAPGQSQLVPLIEPIGPAGGIALPRRGVRSISEPWRSEYDTGLNATFRAIAGSKGAVPRYAPPPPPGGRAPVITPIAIPRDNPVPGEISAAPLDLFRVRELDPDMAREIKSGFFLEPGDCVHIMPWPGEQSGRFMVMDVEMTVELPGPRFVSAKGKSLARLEKELCDLWPAYQGLSQPVVSPCIKTGQSMQMNTD